ncbi:MAG: hypothetical protein ACR2NP_13075 [Pirellulaceae bacterium]
MTADHSNSPIDRYFAGLAENTFQTQLGIVDPTLIDYMSDLLIRFVRSDAVHRIRGVTGSPLMSVTEMAAEAAERLGEARREVHRHVGDFTLFWAGVYPEALRRRGNDAELQFETYCSQGKRSYLIASTIKADNDEAIPGSILERLSDSFELCAFGLREVRREWESRDDNSEGSGPILLN